MELFLQYDAKMLKLQKQQNARAQHVAQSSSTNNDIFRKVKQKNFSFEIRLTHVCLQKLQHIKIESEKEINSLKRKVEELERQLQTNNRAAKKNRLM